MPFYTRRYEDSDELVVVDAVTATDFEFNEENHADYTYPLFGWYWFPDLETARAAILTTHVSHVDSVTMRQARLALYEKGVLSAVESSIASMSEEVKIEWQYAQEIQRNNPLVAAIAAQLNWSEQQLDELFALGKTL